MIGNDIVDLKLAAVQSNWRRRGFLEKVYTPNEQSLILGSSRPDIVVWRLWSMKESAYKARLRVEKQIQINPKDFDCQLITEDKGFVICDSKIYCTLSEIDQDYIHTQAYAEEFDADLSSQVIDLKETRLQSKNLYAVMMSSLAISMSWEQGDMRVEKNHLGIPELYRKGQKINVLCSLSHHGRYGSYLTTA